MKRFCTVLLTSQLVMVISLQPKGREFESTHVLVFFIVFFFFFYPFLIRLSPFIIDVPRPLSNFLWIIYSKGWCVTHTLNQSVWNNCVLQNRMVYVINRLKPLFLDQYFQFCKYRHASKLFVYLYLHLLLLFL